uniref:cGMP-dependent protein kinase n=1 Tax=Albugo laibachii Nc14 TaxID=890382 RepID=F0WV47_9STRA|nr:calcium/calmodulindependent protein kinase kinase pu [Albugo laibachii Nc14]|eukprot:CCA25284.1 calcium/calmodulindependent protein kinase kinase pu [Albugo laibachii Nc14]
MGDRVSKQVSTEVSNQCEEEPAVCYEATRDRKRRQNASGVEPSKLQLIDNNADVFSADSMQRTLLRRSTQQHFRPHHVPQIQVGLSRQSSLRSTFAERNDSDAKLYEIASLHASSYSDLTRKEDEMDVDDQDNQAAESNSTSESDDEDFVTQTYDEIEVDDWLSEPSNGNSVDKAALLSGDTGQARGNKTHWNNLTVANSEDAEDDTDDELNEVQLTPFIRENMPIYEIMQQVQIFRNLSLNQQEQVLKVLKPARFSDGQVIVKQGTSGDRFYMIAKGNAVVTKTVPDSAEERMVTHLRAGHYFGELALIYDDPHTATVRAVGDVELFYLMQSDFQGIGQVHLSLMLQQVPLLARLNARAQDFVLSRLQPAIFSDKQYIVRQGEEGTRFYMITKGEAIVTEHDLSVADSEEKELTRLYEGHVFGEMSLIYQEPRTASVRAIGDVKCLYLNKVDFDECLMSDNFQRFVREEYMEKSRRRAMRIRLQQQQTIVQATAATDELKEALVPCVQSMSPSLRSTLKTTETRKLVTHRLANGQKVVNKYVIQGDLGRGTFGRVKLCQNEKDGQLYAVKIMHKSFTQRMAGKEDSLQDALRREVAILKKLNHPNIVKLIEVIDDPSSEKVYLVQEYVQHSLMEEVQSASGLPQDTARMYLRDLLAGLYYLHYHNIIHFDIKPENILITSGAMAKIADFGTARMILHESETLSDAKGTPAFMAPEMFNIGAKFRGPSVDVWSLGATLYMMVIGRPPWLAENEIKLAERVQQDELCFSFETSEKIDPHLKNLLVRMLTKTPESRISLMDCINHDWVTKEGSDPLPLHLSLIFGDKAIGKPCNEDENPVMTISLDESDNAIQRIPEQIDQSLSDCLIKAHWMIKNRLQQDHYRVPMGSNQRFDSEGDTRTNSTSKSTPTSSDSTHSVRAGSGRVFQNNSEDVSNFISAWRDHKRVLLGVGHTNLSDRILEVLLEQNRMAISADRAMVTEIIMPSAPGSVSMHSNSSLSSLGKVSIESDPVEMSTDSLEGLERDDFVAQSLPKHMYKQNSLLGHRYQSLPNINSLIEEENQSILRRKRSSNSFVDSAVIHPTPTSVIDGSPRYLIRPRSATHLKAFSSSQLQYQNRRDDLVDQLQFDSWCSNPSKSCSANSIVSSENDAQLMKRSLSRKKDFLMVTSEVLMGQDGDYQTRKIMFQARDHDFSVASRAPISSKLSVSQLIKSENTGYSNPSAFASGTSKSASQNSSGCKFGSPHSSLCSVLSESNRSFRSERSKAPSQGTADLTELDPRKSRSGIDLDGLGVTEINVEDVGETICAHVLANDKMSDRDVHSREGKCLSPNSQFWDKDESDSDYSEAEDAMDVDATFKNLVAGPSDIELVTREDEDLAPLPEFKRLCNPDSSACMENSVASLISSASSYLTSDQTVQVYVSSQIRENLILGIRSGYAEAKGARASMEDRSLVRAACNLNEFGTSISEQFASLAVFGVFDGHNGYDTASHLQTHLVETLLSNQKFAWDPQVAIKESCEQIDETILRMQNQSWIPRRSLSYSHQKEAMGRMQSTQNLQPISFSGATGVFAIMMKDKRRGCDNQSADTVEVDDSCIPTKILIGNVGDSRAVLAQTNGSAQDLTKDHKASDTFEKRRIEASGGFVHNGRLDGILAISRGFGDLAHKQDGHLISDPDVIEHVISVQDELLLLASDGLFDVLNSQQAVNLIRRKLRHHGDVQLAAHELILKAQEFLSHDNISVIIVVFNQSGT